jgi:hypothetical protein
MIEQDVFTRTLESLTKLLPFYFCVDLICDWFHKDGVKMHDFF